MGVVYVPGAVQEKLEPMSLVQIKWEELSLNSAHLQEQLRRSVCFVI